MSRCRAEPTIIISDPRIFRDCSRAMLFLCSRLIGEWFDPKAGTALMEGLSMYVSMYMPLSMAHRPVPNDGWLHPIATILFMTADVYFYVPRRCICFCPWCTMPYECTRCLHSIYRELPCHFPFKLKSGGVCGTRRRVSQYYYGLLAIGLLIMPRAAVLSCAVLVVSPWDMP